MGSRRPYLLISILTAIVLALGAPGCAAEPEVEESERADEGAVAAAIGPTACPVQASISRGWFAGHDGVDLAAPFGTPIYAVAGGLVVDSGPAQGYGQWIRIRHDDGSLTEYGHMRTRFVNAGQRVAAGQRIALVASEGQSTGPHLHLRTFNRATDRSGVDPFPYLRARRINLPCQPGVIGNSASLGLTVPTKCPGGSGTVIGSINVKYLELGGCQSSALGLPKSDEQKTADDKGRYTMFERGMIYWTAASGAKAVHGLIFEKYKELGLLEGALGFPTSDELTPPDKRGRFTVFEKGSIYFTSTTGAHEVLGVIRDKWKDLGWEAGSLGYPTSGQYDVAAGRRSDFEKGYITWDSETNVATETVK